MPIRLLSILLCSIPLLVSSTTASAVQAKSPTVSVRLTLEATLPASMSPPAARARASRSELRDLRNPATTSYQRRAIARAQAARRSAALRRRLTPMIDANRSRVARLMAGVRRLGGRISSVDGLFGSLVAEIPGNRAREVAVLPGVAAVERVVATHDLSSWDSPTVSVGAPAFWAAGFLGGMGTNDTRAGSLAVIEDLILRDHPDFAGVHFETATTSQKPLDANERHGTMVASMAVGQGVSSCPSAVGYTCDVNELHPENKGVAPGPATVLDGQSVTNDADWSVDDGFSQFGWILGIAQHGVASSRVLPGASEPAQVATDSNGSVIAGVDYTSADAEIDALGDQLGLLYVQAAGNDGTSLPTICRARNPLCVGAVDTGWTGDTSDDQIASYSTRGPSYGGQKKPDLVAVGNALVANRSWQTDSHLFTSQTGTSFSAPQVAAAATLLVGSGITDPLAIKAVLIDSARQGRGTPGDPMGSQTTWQPDWGWGMLDLNQALAQRTNFATRTISSNETQFFSSTTVDTGDRATLAWNRRAAYCGNVQTFCADGNGQATSSGLTNLDLSEHAAAAPGSCGGSPLATSTSTLDNVEQVRSPVAQSVIYRVSSGPVTGASSEPYSIATTRQLTPLAAPVAVTVQRSDGGADTLQIGQTATLTVTVSNPSTITACAPDAQLLLEGSGTIVSSTPAQDPGSLIAPGQVLQRSYEIRATGPGQLTAEATGTTHAYGSTLSRTARVDISVPPPVVPPPPPDGPVPPGPNPPIQLPPPPGTIDPPIVKRTASKVRIVRGTVARDRRTITIVGTTASHVTGKVRLQLRVRIGGRTKTYTKRLAVRAGRFSTKIRLSSKNWKRATAVVSYTRTARFAASKATRTIRRPS